MDKKIKELCSYRQQKANTHIECAEILLAQERYSDSIILSCFSVFDAVNALNGLSNLNPKTHMEIFNTFYNNFVANKVFDSRVGEILERSHVMYEKIAFEDMYFPTKEQAEAQLLDAKMLKTLVRNYIDMKDLTE